jgi:hypothetical protein
VATDGKTWTAAAGLASVVAATGTVLSPLSIGTAAAFGALSIGGGVMKTLENERKLQENEMFFLYETGNELKKREAAKNLQKIERTYGEMFQVYD